jgi:hypothetical protein
MKDYLGLKNYPFLAKSKPFKRRFTLPFSISQLLNFTILLALIFIYFCLQREIFRAIINKKDVLPKPRQNFTFLGVFL